MNSYILGKDNLLYKTVFCVLYLTLVMSQKLKGIVFNSYNMKHRQNSKYLNLNVA